MRNILGLVLCLTTGTAFGEEVTIARIVDAWKSREAATKTFSAEIEEDRFTPKGSPTGLEPEDKPLPADVEQLFRRTLAIDGDLMSHKVVSSMWDRMPKAALAGDMTSVFDGAIAKTLYVKVAAPSIAFVHSKPNHPDRRNLFLAPLLMRYRPFSAELGSFAPQNWEIVDADAALNGTRCVHVRAGKIADLRYREFWLDIEKDMALVRYQTKFDTRLENELHVEFAQDDKRGWIPSRWKVAWNANGKLLSSATGKLARLSLNEPIDPATFFLEFPAGTEVNDGLLRKQYVVQP